MQAGQAPRRIVSPLGTTSSSSSWWTRAYRRRDVSCCRSGGSAIPERLVASHHPTARPRSAALRSRSGAGGRSGSATATLRRPGRNVVWVFAAADPIADGFGARGRRCRQSEGPRLKTTTRYDRPAQQLTVAEIRTGPQHRSGSSAGTSRRAVGDGVHELVGMAETAGSQQETSRRRYARGPPARRGAVGAQVERGRCGEGPPACISTRTRTGRAQR